MDKTNDAGLLSPWNRATLPGLLRRQAQERPDGPLWNDCPFRESWNGVESRKLKTTAALAATRFLAAQLLTLGVQPGDHVLVLLANMVEVPMAVLACQLAGAIPAVMPVDEKVETIRAAAEKLAVTTIVTCATVEDIAIGDKARQVAAKVLTIRCVAGFGFNLPEGVVSLEGWSSEDVVESDMAEPAPDAVALVTFMRVDGLLVPARRTHAQIIAEALALQASLGGIDFGEIVSALHPGSAAPFAGSFGLSLVAGCPVSLVGPYSREAMQKRLRNSDSPLLLVPAHFITKGEATALRDLAQTATVAFTRASDEETTETLPPTVLARLIAAEERAVIAIPSDYDPAQTLAKGQPRHPQGDLLASGRLWLAPGEAAQWEGLGAAAIGDQASANSQAA